jgi:hypothetical protein
VDWIDNGNVHDFSCHGIHLRHSSVYTVFNFIYIISAKKKMGVVPHKQHSINYTHLEMVQRKKKTLSISSQQHSAVVSCAQRWRSERQLALLHICVICLTVHIQLTSGSAFISENVIGTGSSSSSTSEPSFTFIFMACFAS